MQARCEEMPLRFSPYSSMIFTASILTPSLSLICKPSTLRMGPTVQRFLRVISRTKSNSPYKKGKINIRSMRKVRIFLNLKTGTVIKRQIANQKLRGRNGKERGKNEKKWWISVECSSKNRSSSYLRLKSRISRTTIFAFATTYCANLSNTITQYPKRSGRL